MTSEKFVIYGKDDCIHCDRAKDLLRQRGLMYDYANVVTDPVSFQMFRTIFPTARTVPQVISPEGTPIGTADDLERYLKNERI